MDKRTIRKRATREEMIERLRDQNAQYEMKITRNNAKIDKLKKEIKPNELVEKIKQAGLSISDVVKMIEEKTKQDM